MASWLSTIGGGALQAAKNIYSTYIAPKPQPQSQPQVKGVTTAAIPQYAFQAPPTKPTTSFGQLTSSSKSLQTPTGGASNSGSVLGITQQATNNVQNAFDDYNALLDRDYEISMGEYNNQESSLRNQSSTAQMQIGNEFDAANTQLNREQTTNIEGVQGEVKTAESEAQTASRQARDLFRQTQQANIAQLSGLGISSSSVTEALAETLGVETARRLGGITGSLTEVRQNASKELGRINNYFEERKTQLASSKATELSKIQQSFTDALSSINSARDRSANDKARQRTDLLYNARSAVEAINNQAVKFQESLDTWAKSKSDSLKMITASDDWINSFNRTQGVLSQSFNPTQFDLSPTVNTNNRGEVSYSFAPKRIPTDEETIDEDKTGEIDYTNTAAWKQ